jgi:DNA polymerase-3 subunit gamma/tau
LRNAVVSNEVAHAYLFAGERGIGKTSVARILARAINCLEPQAGEPCNTCANCRTILANRSLDILEIDGASNRGIDHIRRLREEVNFSPTDLRTKVYIIDEVHMLTNEASNALLKTLEEPPPHAVFIFATTEPHKLPRTIVSRCQAFDFRKIPQEKIASRLAEIAKSEKVEISEEALNLLARKANGGMRDATVMLEQAASYRDGEITPEGLLEMLGLVGREESAAFLEALERGDRQSVLGSIDALVERGKDLELFLADLVEALRDRIARGCKDEAHDVRLAQGLLRVKQDLFRSLDRRILLEIGILSLMNEETPGAPPPAGATRAAPAAPMEKREEEKRGPLPKEKASAQGGTSPALRSAPPDEGPFASAWKEILHEIERERVAIAAFLMEGRPRLEENRVRIAFHPEHAFHKESLEKTANLQYLAGMVHRHLGEGVCVEIEFDDGVVRKPSPREALLKKAELVCELFDGRIVKEE